jgi:hypothetical protein
MTDIVDRLRFDAARARCEATFSNGVASNIEESAAEIERLRSALKKILDIDDQPFGGDWEEIQQAREIAHDALQCVGGNGTSD